MIKLFSLILFLLFHLHSSSSKAFMRRIVEVSTDAWENEEEIDEKKYTINQIKMVEDNGEEEDKDNVSEIPVSHWLQLINKRESSSYIVARALVYIGIVILALAVVCSTANVISLSTFCVSEDILGESTNVLIRSKKFQKKIITKKDTKAYFFANCLRDRIPFSFVDYAQRINTAYKKVRDDGIQLPGFKPEDLPIPESVTKIPEIRMSPRGPRVYSASSYVEPRIPSFTLKPKMTTTKRSRNFSDLFRTPQHLFRTQSAPKAQKSRSSSDDISVFSLGKSVPRFVINPTQSPTPTHLSTPGQTSTPTSPSSKSQLAFKTKQNITTTPSSGSKASNPSLLVPPKTLKPSIPKISPPPSTGKKSKPRRRSSSFQQNPSSQQKNQSLKTPALAKTSKGAGDAAMKVTSP